MRWWQRRPRPELKVSNDACLWSRSKCMAARFRPVFLSEVRPDSPSAMDALTLAVLPEGDKQDQGAKNRLFWRWNAVSVLHYVKRSRSQGFSDVQGDGVGHVRSKDAQRIGVLLLSGGDILPEDGHEKGSRSFLCSAGRGLIIWPAECAACGAGARQHPTAAGRRSRRPTGIRRPCSACARDPQPLPGRRWWPLGSIP